MPIKCLNPSDKSIFSIDIRRFQANNADNHHQINLRLKSPSCLINN